MRISRIIVTLCFVFVAIITSAGQTKPAAGDWESKPVDQWREKDVDNILHHSAWSRLLEGADADNVSFGHIEQPLFATFTLESALTVRLAALRKRQLDEKYDTM